MFLKHEIVRWCHLCEQEDVREKEGRILDHTEISVITWNGNHVNHGFPALILQVFWDAVEIYPLVKII